MAQTLHNEVPDFASNLLMSDEARFELNGTVNKQNWSSDLTFPLILYLLTNQLTTAFDISYFSRNIHCV